MNEIGVVSAIAYGTMSTPETLNYIVFVFFENPLYAKNPKVS